MYSPKTRRRASEISPTVAKASTAAAIAGIRFSPERARRSTSATAAAARAESRRARSARTRSICARSSVRIDAQRGNGRFLFRDELIHADDDLLAALDGALIFVRGLLNFALHVSGFDGAQHSAERVDFRDVFLRARFDFVRQLFDGVGAADRVHRIRHAGFVRDDLLRAQRQQRGVFGGQRQRFVQSRWCAATGSRPARRPSA